LKLTKAKVTGINAAYSKVQDLAKDFVQDLPLKTMEELEDEDEDLPDVMAINHALFKSAIESYLQGLDTSPVRTLKELIERNSETPEELPQGYTQQDILEKDLDFKLDGFTPEEAAERVRARARNCLGEVFSNYKNDIIIGPADSLLTTFVAAAGYPLASMPIGVLDFDGRPFGITALTEAHGEPLLIQLMSVWERLFLGAVPLALVDGESEG
jgi:amidase